MSKTWGEDRLIEQTLDWVEGNLRSFLATRAIGDSPIEKLFHAALFARVSYFYSHWDPFIQLIDPENGGDWRRCLCLQSQVQIGAHRVDFVVYSWTDGELRSGEEIKRVQPGWRRLVVECDGHDFHERTKEQAARDRSRDRELNDAGYDVFRFTGTELWRDPMGCAEQVITWALRGLGV